MKSTEVCARLKYDGIDLRLPDGVILKAYGHFNRPTDASSALYAQYGSRCGNHIHYEVFVKGEDKLGLALHDERSCLENDLLRLRLAQIADANGVFKRNDIAKKQFSIQHVQSVECRGKELDEIVSELESKIAILYGAFEDALCEANLDEETNRKGTSACGSIEWNVLVSEAGIRSFESILKNDDRVKQIREIWSRSRKFHDKFNIFNVLGLSDYEIRHSFMLCWLLNPNGNHGLGSEFLQGFLAEVVGANEQRLCGENLTFRQFGEDLKRINVDREVDDIDIRLVDNEQKVVIVIENKWDACEREDSGDQVGQLKKYVAQTSRNFPDPWRRYYVFLTPTGRLPSEDNRELWNVVGYDGILRVFENMQDRIQKLRDQDVRVLIQHYKEIVERKVTMEKTLKDLCNEVFQSNMDVLKAIYDNVDQNLLRHPILSQLANGIDINGEHLQGLGNARPYVQYKRRLPSDSGSSIHYEITKPDNSDEILVEVHVEDRTAVEDKTAKETRSLFLSEIKKHGLPAGFRCTGRGLKKAVKLSCEQDTSETIETVKNAFRELYLCCEPILKSFEEELSKGKADK